MRPRTAIPAAAALVATTGWAVRAGRSSGVTPDERDRTLPGDDLVPGARVVIDRATWLPAPAIETWPWLVQLGKDRGGWYLPRWLEQAVPRGRRGLRHVDPALQTLAVGDEVPDWGPGDPVFRVVELDPPRALVYLSQRPRSGPEPLRLSWALALTDAAGPDGGLGSRLQLRLRINRVGRRAPALVATLAGLVDEATVRPMFAGLAERLTSR